MAARRGPITRAQIASAGAVVTVAGLLLVVAAHRWAGRHCCWLGEVMAAPLLVLSGALTVGIFLRTRRARWLCMALFIAFIVVDTTFNLGARFGMWLLLHPAQPVHLLDSAFPGLHLHTWPEMVLEAAVLVAGIPLGLMVLWDMRRDRPAAATLVGAGVLAAFLFVVLLAGSGGGDHVPFRPRNPVVLDALKDATEFLVGMAFCLSFALYAMTLRSAEP